MSVRADNPLAFAMGSLVGSVVTSALIIGGHVFAAVMQWRRR